jgi:hypothetical protein
MSQYHYSIDSSLYLWVLHNVCYKTHVGQYPFCMGTLPFIMGIVPSIHMCGYHIHHKNGRYDTDHLWPQTKKHVMD